MDESAGPKGIKDQQHEQNKMAFVHLKLLWRAKMLNDFHQIFARSCSLHFSRLE